MDNRIIRDHLIDELTSFLPVLRASVGISQEQLSSIIGISRQTYCAYETKKSKMSWTVFMALFLFFTSNQDSQKIIEHKKDFVLDVYEYIRYTKTSIE